MNPLPVPAIGRAPLVKPSDFTITSFIQQGGAGKVFSGVWNSGNRKKVALKFFGYTKREPNRREIDEEIELLQSLRGVNGIVQLEALFDDPPTGTVPGKMFRVPYPCIVMELLEGGELFDKIECSASVSEKDLALIFRGIVLALDSLHQRRFVHRDVKLENLMLANKKPHSPVKIIDVGMMVRMQPHKAYYRSSSIQGTVGYVAPETLLHKMYSPASDMWQAGVCLYSMLSGFSPFHPKHPEQITEHTYFPMKGVGWDNISDAAKDLISKILVKNVPDRITAAEILRHPWVTTEEANRDDLGSEYLLRIKHLGIRQKMKTFFVENNIEEGNRLRRDHLKLVMPTIHKAATSPSKESMMPEGVPSLPAPCGLEAPMVPSITSLYGVTDLTGKLKELKRAVLKRSSVNKSMHRTASESSPSVQGREDSGGSETSVAMSVTDSEPVLLPAPPVQAPVAKKPAVGGEIEYEAFLEILHQCNLPELANRQVFSIFDIGNTGTINPKDFLLTMLAFRPEDEAAAARETGEEAARLYFNIFDINECGFIDLEELKVAVAFLLEEESLPMMGGADATSTSATSSVEDLFAAIDVTKDGRIDFEEFKVFYETVLVYSTTRRSITMSGGNHGIEHGDEDDKHEA